MFFPSAAELKESKLPVIYLTASCHSDKAYVSALNSFKNCNCSWSSDNLPLKSEI